MNYSRPPAMPLVLPPYRTVRWITLGRPTVEGGIEITGGKWQKSVDGTEWVDVPPDDYAGWVTR